MNKYFLLAVMLGCGPYAYANVPLVDCGEYIKNGKFTYSDETFPLQQPKLIASCSEIQKPVLEDAVSSAPFGAKACIIFGTLGEPNGKSGRGIAVMANINFVNLKAPLSQSGLSTVVTNQVSREGSKVVVKENPNNGFELEKVELQHKISSDDYKERVVFDSEAHLLKYYRTDFDEKTRKMRKTLAIEFLCKP
jgi:hypothetical protein